MARKTATPPRYNKKGEGGGVIAVIIITKYIIKQSAWGGAQWRGGVDIHPSTHTQKADEDARKGLKTAPFQCQCSWGGVNERLGEGAGVKPGCHIVCSGESRSRPGGMGG